ncbi:hypothetical protein Agabi119p4_2320 [Agaricus bisporus var. burnettii]|uniref:Uncharacterized protein n=1 Tax=Agaricus bisporus var. burnettii TaxID=192524 RepID=A0A8H7F8X9_AGABI|nr:hypothetical protein Agabi119p4_2320 [Agaricus bisporus var. burnettii]
MSSHIRRQWAYSLGPAEGKYGEIIIQLGVMSDLRLNSDETELVLDLSHTDRSRSTPILLLTSLEYPKAISMSEVFHKDVSILVKAAIKPSKTGSIERAPDLYIPL